MNEPLLSSPAFSIRPVHKDDAESIAKHANNYNIWKHLRDYFPHPYTLQHAEAFIAETMQQDPPWNFVIATKNEAIGCIGLNPQQDVHRYTAEIGFWLAERFWGRGIMTEAVAAFSDLALKSWGLKRIFAGVFANNVASIRVMEKAGFEREGVMRASVFKERLLLDQVLFAKVAVGY